MSNLDVSNEKRTVFTDELVIKRSDNVATSSKGLVISV